MGNTAVSALVGLWYTSCQSYGKAPRAGISALCSLKVRHQRFAFQTVNSVFLLGSLYSSLGASYYQSHRPPLPLLQGIYQSPQMKGALAPGILVC